MSSYIPLAELDNDPGRTFTSARTDLSRLVRKLRHRGFANVTATRDEFDINIRGTHRLTGNRVHLQLLPALAGEREERRWGLSVHYGDGTGVFLDRLWVGTKYRWREMGELDPVGYLAVVAERAARRWSRPTRTQ